MIRPLFLLLAPWSCLLAQKAAPSKAVKEIRASTVTGNLDGEDLYIVEYYSTMCGSCEEFAPVLEKALTFVKKTEPKVKAGKLKIEITENRELAEKEGVLDEGLPTLRVYAKDQGGAVVSSTVFNGNSLAEHGTPSAPVLAKGIVGQIKQFRSEFEAREEL